MLEHIADHQKLNTTKPNIVHMILTTGSQKCMTFVRVEDEKTQNNRAMGEPKIETGRLVLYMTKQSIVNGDFNKGKGFDL